MASGGILLGAAGVGVAGCVGLAAFNAMHPAGKLFGPTVRRTGDSSTVALTFDDGPNPSITPALLDLLDRNGARATFFLIGAFVRQCPALVREIVSRGHAIGNHTETHPNLLWRRRSALAAELRSCQEAIAEAAGAPPVWMRPPYGIRGPQLWPVLRELGLREPVLWSISANDWRQQPPRDVVHRLRRVRGGDIVLLHDGDHHCLGGDRDHTLRAIAHWLPRWKDAGLRFLAFDAQSDSSVAALKTQATGV
jgi:peptidoglycan/xylan/chitin deacetylase (PgdA/CDA1 family)